MIKVDLRGRQALVAQLFLDVQNRDPRFAQTDCASVTQPVDVEPAIESSLLCLAFNELTHVSITNALAAVRAEKIGRRWSALNPRSQIAIQDFARDTGYPTLAALSSAYGHRTSFPVDITWRDIETFVASELGIEIDSEQSAIPDARLIRPEGAQESLGLILGEDGGVES
jgi:hypothetical protein